MLRLSPSDDTHLLRALLRQLQRRSEELYYCNNAGAVARFMMALLAATPGRYVLSGDDRLRQRPMAPLIEALRSLGATITCTAAEGYLPVRIEGGMLHRRTVTLDPSLSSQFASALLLIAPTLPGGLSLTTTTRAASRPYIEMTCQVLRECGANVRQSSNGRTYYVDPCQRLKPPQQVTIERDWSAAAFFYTVAALRPDLRLRLKGLSLNSMQGDVVTNDIFANLGVVSREVHSPYRLGTRSITMSGGGPVAKQLSMSCIDCPDLVPAIVVACAAKQVKASLRGVRNLNIKESDRLQALKTELERMGGRVNIEPDLITVYPTKLHLGGMVRTYGDHRVAMAFATLKTICPELEIEDHEVVSKSFPDFWNQMELIPSL